MISIVLLLIFALLRFGAGVAEPPTTSGFSTTKVVLIGVTGRYQPTATDDKIINHHTRSAQTAAVSPRTRHHGACAAAGWATIGAGRRTTVGGHCRPEVAGSGNHARVTGWSDLQKAAAAAGGDAQLGTLAQVSSGCVQAVGPGAALAAARPDGGLAHYRTADQFAAKGYRPHCPVTIVDAGNDSDAAIKALTRRKDVTTLVAGIGPAAGSHSADLQLAYRIGTTLPGRMTSDSTRRSGVITLPDLTSSLAHVGAGDRNDSRKMRGAPITVRRGAVSADAAADHLTTVHNRSHVAPVGYAVGGGAAILLAVITAIAAMRRRWSGARTAVGALTIWPAALLLTGTYPWAGQPHPAAALVTMLITAAALLTAGTLLVKRLGRIPIPVAAATLIMAAFTLDAALGAVFQPGSLLSSPPADGGKWFGFGPAAFGCYAAAVLTVAGYLAHRFRWRGHRIAPVVTVVILGAVSAACVGSSSMGSDTGGFASLISVLVGLVLAVSGLRNTWVRLGSACAAVIVLIGVAVLVWRLGTSRGSHLQDDVQRIVDGDGVAVLVHRTSIELQSMITPYGIPGIICGVAIWVILWRWARHRITPEVFAGYAVTAVAILAVGALQLVLNDHGVVAWMAATGTFAATTLGLLVERYADDVSLAAGQAPSMAGPSGADGRRAETPGSVRATRTRNARRSGNPARRDNRHHR